MRNSKSKVAISGILILVSAVLAFLFLNKAPVSISVVGYTTNQWPAATAARLGSQTYICAVVAITNNGSQSFTYYAFGSTSADYQILHQTTFGWKAPDSDFWCGTGLQRGTLAPSQGLTFEAIVPTDKACKVAFDYSDGRTPNRLWQRLPAGLTRRLPWGKGWKRVTTDVIDLRGTFNVTVKPRSHFQGTEETPILQAAAQLGDAEAEFILAGRYFTGNGAEKNLTEAVRWYEAAATNGHPEAAYNLGTIYEYGLGTTVDQARAIEWYRRAGVLKHSRAQERLQALTPK
jgi:hypothetical protein